MANDQLIVSNEELAQAAINFVNADQEQRDLRQVRKKLMQESNCDRAVGSAGENEEPRDNCYYQWDGHPETFQEFCDRCKAIYQKTIEIRLGMARRNGKLRRLRNLVRKMEGV